MDDCMCGRNIAKKRDFCSFRLMKYFVFIVSSWVLLSPEASATSCTEISEILSSADTAFHFELEIVGQPQPDPCTFDREQTFPFKRGIIDELKNYVNCPGNGGLAADALSRRLNSELEVAEIKNKETCKAPSQ